MKTFKFTGQDGKGFIASGKDLSDAVVNASKVRADATVPYWYKVGTTVSYLGNDFVIGKLFTYPNGELGLELSVGGKSYKDPVSEIERGIKEGIYKIKNPAVNDESGEHSIRGGIGRPNKGCPHK